MSAIIRPTRRPISSWRASVFGASYPFAPRPGQGLLSDHLAVAQPWRRERVFVLRLFGRVPGSGAMEHSEAGVRKALTIRIVCTQ